MINIVAESIYIYVSIKIVALKLFKYSILEMNAINVRDHGFMSYLTALWIDAKQPII